MTVKVPNKQVGQLDMSRGLAHVTCISTNGESMFVLANNTLYCVHQELASRISKSLQLHTWNSLTIKVKQLENESASLTGDAKEVRHAIGAGQQSGAIGNVW